MEEHLLSCIYWLLGWLSLPKVGLSAIFIVCLISATLLPLGSEPLVFGYIKLAPHMFWPAILTASAGNTIGGVISYFTGWAAARVFQPSLNKRGRWDERASAWLNRLGPVALLLSWLPIIGDPLCAAAGWLRLPFWPCLIYMAIGKFARYVIMSSTLLWFFPNAIHL